MWLFAFLQHIILVCLFRLTLCGGGGSGGGGGIVAGCCDWIVVSRGTCRCCSAPAYIGYKCLQIGANM